MYMYINIIIQMDQVNMCSTVQFVTEVQIINYVYLPCSTGMHSQLAIENRWSVIPLGEMATRFAMDLSTIAH